MKLLQNKANEFMEKRQYIKAYTCFYEAALYYPKVFLLFSAAQARLMGLLTQKHISTIDVLFVLEDYKLGIEFYKYEKMHYVSISTANFNKMQRQEKCLHAIYIKYKKYEGKVENLKNEILNCK